MSHMPKQKSAGERSGTGIKGLIVVDVITRLSRLLLDEIYPPLSPPPFFRN